MASLYTKVGIFFFMVLHLSTTLHSTDNGDDLILGINSYRKSFNLPILAKNDKADCLADEVANKLEDQPCRNPTPIPNTPINVSLTFPGPVTQISTYPKFISKCNIDPNTTQDGIILPVCVHKRVLTLVLNNYTHTGYAKYINDSKFNGIGVGSEDDWTVVVLSTGSQSGSLASGGFGLRSNGAAVFGCLVVVAVVFGVVGFGM